MRNTPYDGDPGIRLPPDVQLKRLRRVMEQELTELQRQTLAAYYFEQQNIVQIAAARGVNKSTVSRTLRRAESKLRRLLKY